MKSIKLVRNLAALLAVPVISILLNTQAQAAPFIPGNIVVTQYGDGSAALSSTSAPVFVMEYLPSTAGQVIPVQTISIPTTGTNRLTVTGNSTTEGFIARSLNSSNVTFIGYDASLGTNAISSTTGTANNRCIGQLDANGNFTRIASGSGTAYSGSNIRSAISDGTNYWTAGTAGTTSQGGIWYSANGAAWSQIGTGNASGNIRVTKIFNGSLLLSTGSGTVGLWSYNGIPNSSATATNMITTTTASPYDFAINPAGNVAYINDDSALSGGGATGGGIEKWTFNGTAWSRAFTMGLSNSLTAGCRGMAVDFSGANPVIYATTADTATKLIKITDTSAFAAITNVTDQAITLAVAPANTAFRGVALAPPSASSGTAPAISGITPPAITNSIGSTVTFTLTGGTGYPAASNFWYQVSGGTTNLISGATAATLTLTNVQATNTAKYFAILTNAYGSTTSSVASLTVVPGYPSITGISPTNVTVNASQTVTFTLSGSFGIPVSSNFWYKIAGSTTNLISGATGTTLTFSNVLGSNTASYFAILTNAFGSSTSSVASLTVIDPIITAQPNSAQGLVDGTVQFIVTTAGTAPSYQWYFSDTSGNIIAPAVSLGDASVISGANSSTLTITNLQFTDQTNFVVVVTNVYGAVTSSVASLLSVTNSQAMLAFWDFDGSQFTNTAVNPNSENNPVPLIGNGTALPVGSTFLPGTSPFSGSTDANDVAGVFTPYGFPQLAPNFSWGTSSYPANPATGSNKLNGVQFNVSTVGAKNIIVNYDSRVSATASEYERLQYTTNGTTWIDYPSSSSFNGVSSSYEPFSYNLTGFPGVANNPNFGIRVVTEFPSTATYGISPNTNFLGTANTYGTTGTVTYDLVAIRGDAITNNNAPPTVNGFVNTNTLDYVPITLNFTAGDDTTPPGQLAYSAVSLDPSVSASFTFGGSGTNRTLLITPNYISSPSAAAPIFVSVTDTNGDSTAAWFTLTLASVNQPPTNSLTALTATNILANKSITIPFTVGDDRTPAGGLTYSIASDNNTVVPAANIVIGNSGTTNPTVTITPATNQLGNALISVTVFDNDAQEPRSTTANIAIVVRPNTNVVAVDYFNYDTSGSLDTIAAGYWQHLSGILGQLKAGSGVATVNTAGNTENLQAQLLGSPYKTNSGAVLYSSFTVNMSSSTLPTANGSYITAFNDASGNTADVEDCLVAATNGAAPGYYRLGIANVVGATALNAKMFPQDLLPGSNYVVITSLVLSNGFSTLWINPTNQSSPSVTDTTPAATATNLYNIADFELRESGATAGIIGVGNVMAGLAFASVFYPPVANPDSYAVTENTANLLSPLQNDGGSGLKLVSVGLINNGTAAISGTNVTFTPTTNFTGTATIGYTIMDDIGETNSSTITVTVTNIPPLANPDAYTVAKNSVTNLFSPLTNDVVETPGGTLKLISVTPTNGTAAISGNQVLFTPATNFVGAATIGYTITDNIGGTNASLITVTVGNVTPIPLNVSLSGGQLTFTWSDSSFSLQSSTNVVGPYTTIVGATNPYVILATNTMGFFRLIH
jgi:Big-like domain-containing protein